MRVSVCLISIFVQSLSIFYIRTSFRFFGSWSDGFLFDLCILWLRVYLSLPFGDRLAAYSSSLWCGWIAGGCHASEPGSEGESLYSEPVEPVHAPSILWNWNINRIKFYQGLIVTWWMNSILCPYVVRIRPVPIIVLFNLHYFIPFWYSSFLSTTKISSNGFSGDFCSSFEIVYRRSVSLSPVARKNPKYGSADYIRKWW